MSQLNSGGSRDLALNLLSAANRADEPANWLAAALPAIAAELSAAYVAVIVADGGRWNVLGESGPARSLPVELLAEVLDREVVRSQGNWIAGPLSARAVASEALLACWAGPPPPDALAAVESLLPVVREAFASVRAVTSSGGESAAWRRSSKSPTSGTRRERSNRCWCKWPRPPRAC